METVKCEICGKEVPESEAHYYEPGEYHVCQDCYDNEFVTCERCGEHITYDEAHEGFDGYLCDCCYDDLFG